MSIASSELLANLKGRGVWYNLDRRFVNKSLPARGRQSQKPLTLFDRLGNRLLRANYLAVDQQRIVNCCRDVNHSSSFIVTNVYEKLDGRWLMVSHHVQAKPQ